MLDELALEDVLDFETVHVERNHRDTTPRLLDLATGLLLPFKLVIAPKSCSHCFAESGQGHHPGCLKSDVVRADESPERPCAVCGIETEEAACGLCPDCERDEGPDPA